MVRTDKHDLERSAYHEAGHAVAHYMGGIKFKYVEIYETPRKPFSFFPKAIRELKDVTLGGYVKQIRKKKIPIPSAIIIAMAGGCAEFIRDKRTKPLYNCCADLEKMKEFFRGKEDFDVIFDTVKSLMMEKEAWCAVTALAKQLLIERKIPYKKAIQIIENSSGEFRAERR